MIASLVIEPSERRMLGRQEEGLDLECAASVLDHQHVLTVRGSSESGNVIMSIAGHEVEHQIAHFFSFLFAWGCVND